MTTSTSGLSQEQFLKVLSREEAMARFDAALTDWRPTSAWRALDQVLGAVLAADIRAPGDVPPFDRALVDGFALRAADLAAAGPGQAVALRLTGEEIACGHAPQRAVGAGQASVIATGGPIPRGADAVVMVEHSEPGAPGEILLTRPALPGQFIGWAGGDMAAGETLLRQGTVIGAREIGMLAACGLAGAAVIAPPRIAVLSTGDELAAPGQALAPGQIHDANGPMIAAATREQGAEAQFLGALPDDAPRLEAAMRAALAAHDMLILSGGTSKGAGDLTHRLIGGLGAPGIIVHGVALKPGKPLCLAVCDGKPVVVLPGFPTSAMFTFHDMIAPVIRRRAGLAPRPEHHLPARLPARIGSEVGRTEFAMVSLVAGPEGAVAYPTGKGSGAVTSFAQADGFLRIPALADHLPQGAAVQVALFSPALRLPDLVIIGSHCTGLDLVTGALARRGLSQRVIAMGSLGGLQALGRGECDLAPIHLLDGETGQFNRPFLGPGQRLIPGWRRLQGLAFRRDDPRFAGAETATQALARALADGDCLMVGRNQGAGTRLLIDQLLAGQRPPGYWNQPRSHNAVAASVVQGRADWGVTIAPVAAAAGLGFLPLTEEHYDFALAEDRADRPAVVAFLDCLAQKDLRAALAQAGFQPAPLPAAPPQAPRPA